MEIKIRPSQESLRGETYYKMGPSSSSDVSIEEPQEGADISGDTADISRDTADISRDTADISRDTADISRVEANTVADSSEFFRRKAFIDSIQIVENDSDFERKKQELKAQVEPTIQKAELFKERIKSFLVDAIENNISLPESLISFLKFFSSQLELVTSREGRFLINDELLLSETEDIISNLEKRLNLLSDIMKSGDVERWDNEIKKTVDNYISSISSSSRFTSFDPRNLMSNPTWETLVNKSSEV